MTDPGGHRMGPVNKMLEADREGEKDGIQLPLHGFRQNLSQDGVPDDFFVGRRYPAQYGAGRTDRGGCPL